MNGGGGLEGTIHPTDTTHLTDSFTWWPQGSRRERNESFKALRAWPINSHRILMHSAGQSKSQDPIRCRVLTTGLPGNSLDSTS